MGPKPPTGGAIRERVGDPSYLLVRIGELRDLADRSGLETLAYLLQWSAIEAERQVEERRERDRPKLHLVSNDGCVQP